MKTNTKYSGRHIRLNKQILKPRRGKDYASVVFFGDVHWGSPECDAERAQAMLDYCLQTKTPIFLMGDLVENANRYSVGAGVYEQKITPQKQIEFVVETLSPLAKKKLILGSLSGNHEERTYKETGVNIARIICKLLDIPYLGAACWNLWKVGKEYYRIYTLHGASGARFTYTKMKAISDISHSFAADLIAMGHVHELDTSSQLVQYVDIRNKVVREHKKFLLLTGSYLAYDRGYAQMKGYPLVKLGSPKVKFFANKHDIHISL